MLTPRTQPSFHRRMSPIRASATALVVAFVAAAALSGPTRATEAPVSDDEADAGAAWIIHDGGTGIGAGRTVVLISGDEEYRSEEALPQLARILAERHGFRCVVLFPIDPESGEIDPEHRRNIPGLHHLADADLMVIATRFRDLPDDQMAHIDAYVRSGRPIIGLRTATHGFALESSDTYARYNWNHDDDEWRQGFGREILGETWIAHHGAHGSESTRGVVPEGVTHPITRGLSPGSVWGPSDVYRVRLPLPDGCRAIVLGEVVAGMSSDDPAVTGPKNDPMMPIAWVRVRPVEPGAAGSGRVFTTTMGAATDLEAPGTRRMLVNAAYWTMGMEDLIPPAGADARLVGSFDPSPFSFGGHRRGVRPADLVRSPSGTGDAR